MENYFAKNFKYLRLQRGYTQEEMGKKLGKDYSAIGKWENGTRSPIMEDVVKISLIFDVPINELLGKDLKFDNARVIDIVETIDIVEIPVLGKIHAGKSMEAQEDIINYIDVPKSWIKGKKCYGLYIDGDCMAPKYNHGEIVIFKQQKDCESGQDCAVAVNGEFEASFKKIIKTDKGLILQPYNDKYESQMFTNEEVEKLPIKIMGVAFKKFGDID